MRFQAITLGIGITALFLGVAAAEQQQQDSADQAKALFARAKADDFLGSEACADCHSEKAAAFIESPHAQFVSNPSLPLNKQGCEGCHGPGGIHQAEENAEVLSFRKMDSKEASAACMRCHGETLSESHWKRTAHARADVSCISCHQIHPDSASELAAGTVHKGDAGDPRTKVATARVLTKEMLKADETTLCGQCHAPQVAEFRLHSHHPVPEGRMSCSDCHSLHPNKGERTELSSYKSMCVKCHVEKTGPFVFEHDPVAGFTGDGCVECHKPHGSQNPQMLNSVTRGLCAQCHTDKLAAHYPGKTCWSASCHVAPHGSNTSPRFLAP